MGARSNIVVKQHDGSSVWLYGHWMGEDSINVVAEVLSQRERWSDAPYLARMLFSKMTENEPKDNSIGYGISTYMCDNEYPIIVINPNTNSAWLEDYDWNTQSCEPITPVKSIEEMAVATAISTSFNDLAINLGAVLTIP